MPEYRDNPGPLQRAIDYLRDNDYHEDSAEGEMAEELARLHSEILEAANSADSALHGAADFTGLMAESTGGLDAEEINAPFNEGGSGYEAHQKLWALRDRLG